MIEIVKMKFSASFEFKLIFLVEKLQSLWCETVEFVHELLEEARFEVSDIDRNVLVLELLEIFQKLVNGEVAAGPGQGVHVVGEADFCEYGLEVFAAVGHLP